MTRLVVVTIRASRLECTTDSIPMKMGKRLVRVNYVKSVENVGLTSNTILFRRGSSDESSHVPPTLPFLGTCTLGELLL